MKKLLIAFSAVLVLLVSSLAVAENSSVKRFKKSL